MLRKTEKMKFRKLKTGVATVLAATSFAGVITPILPNSLVVLAEELNPAEQEIKESQFVLDSFRLTHLENHDGLFSNRIGGQLKISLVDDVTEGQELAIDIYQESEAYRLGNKESVRRFVVDSVTPVTIDNGKETVVVGQFDGSTITFNSAIENYEDVQLTVHIGTVVESSYLHYYVTNEETRTEVVPYSTEIRYVYDPKLPEGEEEVLIEGVDGERTIIENVTYYLGEEASRELVSEEVTTAPVQEIIAVGVDSEGAVGIDFNKAANGKSTAGSSVSMDITAANESVLVDEYNQTGVNHVYHVYLNDKHVGTSAIGFETPASVEIREERANDFEHVFSRMAINDEGKINTRLTFADIFSKFANLEEFDGSETVRLTLTAESGTYFHQNQRLSGKVLGLTNAVESVDFDSEEDLEVVEQTDFEELYTDHIIGYLDVEVVYVDGRTLQVDVSMGEDINLQRLSDDVLSDRLFVIEGIQSTATIGEEPYSEDYKAVLEMADEHLIVNLSYGSEETGFNTISEESSTALVNAAGYVYETTGVSGTGTLSVPDVVVESESYEEVVPYSTEIIEDNELPEGVEIVDVEGVNGVRTIVENVTYTDREETAREVVSDEITIEPVIEIIRVGTLLTEDITDGDVEDQPTENAPDEEYGEDDTPIVDDLEKELEDEDSFDESEVDSDQYREDNGEVEEENTLFGEELPDTATSIWTIGAIGGGLLSLGGLTKWLDNRKKKQKSHTDAENNN